MDRWKINREPPAPRLSKEVKLVDWKTRRLHRPGLTSDLHVEDYEVADVDAALKMSEALKTAYPEMERYFAAANAAFNPCAHVNLNGDILESALPKPGTNWYGDDGLVHATIVNSVALTTKCMKMHRFSRHKPVHFVKSPVTCLACIVRT